LNTRTGSRKTQTNTAPSNKYVHLQQPTTILNPGALQTENYWQHTNFHPAAKATQFYFQTVLHKSFSGQKNFLFSMLSFWE
jgi:hypothetical protein